MQQIKRNCKQQAYLYFWNQRGCRSRAHFCDRYAQMNPPRMICQQHRTLVGTPGGAIAPLNMIGTTILLSAGTLRPRRAKRRCSSHGTSGTTAPSANPQ